MASRYKARKPAETDAGRLNRDVAFIMTPPPPDSSRRKREKLKTMMEVFNGLVEHWDKHPEDLDEPVDVVTRATVASYMGWAKSLFDIDDPIQIPVGYLASVGNYDDPNLLEEKKLRNRNVLEYFSMVRPALRSLLNERYAGGRRPQDGIPPEGHRYNLMASPLRGVYGMGRQCWPIRPGS
jgi:hypothetical protein